MRLFSMFSLLILIGRLSQGSFQPGLHRLRGVVMRPSSCFKLDIILCSYIYILFFNYLNLFSG